MTTNETETYRLSDIVQTTDLPVFYNTESAPLRLVIRDSDDQRVCAVRCDAGPATLGNMTADEVVERFAGIEEDAMRDVL